MTRRTTNHSEAKSSLAAPVEEPVSGSSASPSRRKRPNDTQPKQGEPCGRCGEKLACIRIEVEGNDLLMESCDSCDSRSWKLAGERIDLKEALSEVEQHTTRRR